MYVDNTVISRYRFFSKTESTAISVLESMAGLPWIFKLEDTGCGLTLSTCPKTSYAWVNTFPALQCGGNWSGVQVSSDKIPSGLMDLCLSQEFQCESERNRQIRNRLIPLSTLIDVTLHEHWHISIKEVPFSVNIGCLQIRLLTRNLTKEEV